MNQELQYDALESRAHGDRRVRASIVAEEVLLDDVLAVPVREELAAGGLALRVRFGRLIKNRFVPKRVQPVRVLRMLPSGRARQ